MDNIESLIQNLQTGDDTRRRAASYRLGKSKDPRAVLSLIAAYTDPDTGVRRNAIEGLQTIVEKTALDFLSLPEPVRIRVSGLVRSHHVMPSPEEIKAFIEETPESLSASSFTAEVSSEASDYLKLAYQMINQMPESDTQDQYRLDIASILALAIHTAGAPFPRAHSLLAAVMNDLKDDKRALYHAQRALQYEPNDFQAQLVKIDVGVKDVKILTLKPGDLIESRGSFENMAFGTLGRTIGALVATGSVGASQATFLAEVQKLATIYINLCRGIQDVDEYLFMANTLIRLGDMIANTAIITGRPDLYTIVAETSTENLDSEERSEEVREVKRRAKGRYFLYK